MNIVLIAFTIFLSSHAEDFKYFVTHDTTHAGSNDGTAENPFTDLLNALNHIYAPVINPLNIAALTEPSTYEFILLPSESSTYLL